MQVDESRSMPYRPPLPFDHPARKDVADIFDTLMVYTEDDYRRLPRRDRYVWDVDWMDTAMMNGGLDAWFTLMGHHAPETLEALQAIGAENAFREISAVCSFFPEILKGIDEAGVHAMYDEFFERHGRLDERVNEVASGIPMQLDLYPRLLNYWRNADPNEL